MISLDNFEGEAAPRAMHNTKVKQSQEKNTKYTSDNDDGIILLNQL